MRPSVGRIVLYHSTEQVGWAAIITEVRGDADIDLTVFAPGRPLMHRQHVSQGDHTGQWSWPVITPLTDDTLVGTFSGDTDPETQEGDE